MLLTAHQPNFLPYLGFFDKILVSDRFLVVDHVQFVKRGPFGWIHRNRIRSPEGWQWLTIPVLTKGKYTQPISEVAINNQIPWKRKHLRSLEVQYGKAPHYRELIPAIEKIYSRDWELLIDLNEALIVWALETVCHPVELVRTSSLGIDAHSTDLILRMCSELGADRYLSGVHGRDYLEIDRIGKAGISLEFQKFEHPVYEQAGDSPFEPNLCILDFLFRCGPEEAWKIWPPGKRATLPTQGEEKS